MKLDLSATWDGAMEMLRANREIVLVLAGVFFFLPSLAFSLFVPDAGMETAGGGQEPNIEAMVAAFEAFMAEYWWALLLFSLVQSIGVIATLAALGDPARPTVSESIKRGVTMLPTIIGAQILSGLAIFAPYLLVVLLAGIAGSQAIGVLLLIFALPVVLYVMVKLSLSTPAIAIEKQRNPVTALTRSWALTKGNSARLFFFYLLLLVALIVVSMVIGLLFGLVFALLGESLALIASAIVNGLMNAIFAVIAYAVLASLHRHLSNGPVSAGAPPPDGD